MRLHILGLVSLLLLGEAANAQVLAVRSGDHPTFSRITIPLPPSQAWAAHQTDDRVELMLPEFIGNFDTTGVFLRMRKNRITEIKKKDSTLILAVDCSCTATVFRSGPLLVIDVADEGTALAGPPLSRLQRNGRSEATVSDAPIPPSTRSTLPWLGSGAPLYELTSDARTPSNRLQDESRTTVPAISTETHAETLDQIRRDLVNDIADAASNGLLEASSIGFIDSPIIRGEIAAEQVPEYEPAPESIGAMLGNVQITNSMDRLDNFSDFRKSMTSSGSECPSQKLLAVETWADDSSFSAQIGTIRGQLTDARDRLDQDSIVQLARTYLFFGFGAEGLDSLRLNPASLIENRQLVDMALILERGSISRPNSLSQYTDCPSNIALWATLSFEEVPSDIMIDVDAALLALNKLPSHLRKIVAPKLSRKLLQYGDPAAAATAMRSIERLPGDPQITSVMAQADLSLNAGRSAEIPLEKVIQANTEQSPTALVKLVEGKLALGEPIPKETENLVEAYAQELRGTALGGKLRQIQIPLLTKSGEFEQAFAKLRAIEPSISPKLAQDLEERIFEDLSSSATDMVFLEYVLSSGTFDEDSLSDGIKVQMSKRLLDLGFPSQAQGVLANLPDMPRSTERQILLARAALAMLQPFKAQAALIGIETSEAALLTAEAKEMAGAYGEASDIYSQNSLPLQADRTAFLSDNWQEMVLEDSGRFAAVSELSNPPQTDKELGTLGKANEALEESSKAREALRLLLSEPSLQINAEPYN